MPIMLTPEDIKILREKLAAGGASPEAKLLLLKRLNEAIEGMRRDLVELKKQASKPSG